jgi:type II secretory pathway pseudopilin PulG
MRHNGRQHGMTLLELIVALSITVVIIGGLAAALQLIVSTTERGNAEASALHNVQKAAYWISRDAQMARTADISEGDEAEEITLEWIDTEGNAHTSSYCVFDTELLRAYDGVATVAARGISLTEFALSGNILTFRIESTSGGRWSVHRSATGKVYLRPYAGG